MGANIPGKSPDRALKRGVKVFLVGPINDIKPASKNGPKPYLFLATIPANYFNRLYRYEAQKALGGEESQSSTSSCFEREFDGFILNTDGLFQLRRPVKFPEELLEAWSSKESQEVLYYHSQKVLSIGVTKVEYPQKDEVGFKISLENGEQMRLQCSPSK